MFTIVIGFYLNYNSRFNSYDLFQYWSKNIDNKLHITRDPFDNCVRVMICFNMFQLCKK